MSFFHVIFHAFFKSSLFLSTGGIIHENHSNQDSRLYGNSNFSFFSKLFFISRCINLIGFPFCLGFFSKDTILSVISSNFYNLNYIIFLISCCLTIIYSFRILSIRFLKSTNTLTIIKIKEEIKFFLPIRVLLLLRMLIGNFFF